MNLVISKPSFLQSERRAPAQFPVLTMNSVTSGEFMSDFEDYSTDLFPFRDGLRTVRAAFMLDVLRMSDKNGLYIDANGIGEFKKVDDESVLKTAQIINTVASTLESLDVYYSFIPDKSIYSDRFLPGFDAALTMRLLTSAPGMDQYTFIDLTEALDADSFYSTDFHWDQTRLDGVMDALGNSMGWGYDSRQYTRQFSGEFHGAYAGQLALPAPKDFLYCLTNPSLSAKHLSSQTKELEPMPVYDPDRFSGGDPYDIFLSGAQPLVILENDNAQTKKELYVFRDSFSSSLAPLLAGTYSKVTLIDLRYIDMRTLGRYVEFKPGSDVLFLYSTIILNAPEMLLVF